MNDPRRYLYTAIFHMPDEGVFGIEDGRVLRERKSPPATAPAAGSPRELPA